MPTKKFEPGKSGNPAGRPKDKTPATIIRRSIVSDIPAIVSKLAEKAKDGDVAAARVLLERVCPALKAQALPILLASDGTLVEQGAEIIRATLSGEIPPDIGSQLITALANQGRLVELQEMADRLSRIEKQLETRS